jgi:hypothetical protein
MQDSIQDQDLLTFQIFKTSLAVKKNRLATINFGYVTPQTIFQTNSYSTEDAMVWNR